MVLTVAYDQCLRAYDVKSSQVRHAWVNERGCQFTTLEINIEFDEVGKLCVFVCVCVRVCVCVCVSMCE